MSKTKKAVIITAVISVFAGLLIGCTALAFIQDNFTELGTVEYVTNTYETTDAFENIDIRCNMSDIRFVLSDEMSTSRVVCNETKSITHKVEVKDNTLVITSEDNRTWQEHIGIFIGNISATVYLPQHVFQQLTIETTSGDIDIPNTFMFTSASLNTSSGDVTFLAEIGLQGIDGLSLTVDTTSGDVVIDTATIMEKLSVSTSSGEVSISNTAADSVLISTTSGRIETFNLSAGRYDESISFVGGKCNITTSSGEIKLSASEFGECHISTSSGDVRLDGVDADTYDISTSSGSVKGTIRSYKNFIVSTSSGEIDIPSSNPDEPDCRISTSSGDVEIDVVF